MSRIYLTTPQDRNLEPLDWQFVGPRTDPFAIWDGPPPILDREGLLPTGLSLSLRNGSGTPGQTVTVEAIASGSRGGGRSARTFALGLALSAELHVGTYPHVKVRTLSTVPAGCTLYATWTAEIVNRSPLLTTLDYPTPATVVDLPEGCEAITVRDACTLTFSLPQFAATFPVAVAAGQRIGVLWAAVSSNVSNRFICHLRPF